ncbi:MAG TPA: GMC oxidoreductase, partial [Verrucomicrobiae bacterium]
QGQFRALGGFVIPPMLQISKPGRGFHCGSSLPMRAQPASDFETDCLGRPRGWSRIHVVDASVLPSVPATTITFSVMANAHRIASETASAG